MKTYHIATACYTVGKKWLAVLSVVLLCTACEDFIEVGLPSSQFNADAVFEDKASAEAAVADIYADLRDNGMFFGELPGLSNTMANYADELTFYGGPTDVSQQFYSNNIAPSNATVLSWWNSAYSQVYAANAVIEGVAASKGLPPDVKERLTGEGLFLRGLIHFYLSNTFGDVPYITTTDYKTNTTFHRIAASDVLSLVIGDLQEAKALLPEPDPTTRIRANKAIATALLARAYLYGSRYAEAADNASAIINNTTLYNWEENIGDVFLKESSETLWHFAPQNQGNNTNEGAAFIFLSGPPSQVALSTGLMDAFEPGDLRKEFWTKGVTDGATTWYHPYKYRERAPTGASLEYSVVLRLAEQYLIRAESRAMQGELVGAKEDLDRIRNRAGLGASQATTQAQLMAAIEQERRVELFTEYGHRFYDLKRWARLDAVLSAQKPGWQPTDRNLPLPANELRLNPSLLPQNPGY